jgi:peptidoglycan hydrolase-like protein with peptidoglycan-binding domain
VQAFQRATGLEPSGTVGPRTRSELRQAADQDGAQIPEGGFDARHGSGNNRSLGDRIPVREGMQGQDIRVLQDFLRRAGVGSAVVDGEFGPRTSRAVRAFERMSKLPVNGSLDATDIAALRDLAGARALRSTPAAATPPPAGAKATIGRDGLAVAPADAPEAVKQIIAAGNAIARTPYRYGGGHRNGFKDTAYDCSGSVSFALAGARLLKAPMPSGSFTSWGQAGRGQWVTVYANAGHMYMVVAGIRFDTSGRSKADTRWQADDRSPSGYTVRHPAGL